ncbi:hypothetical protein B0O99DRAFT_264563, partial [Bisporella sp. PMI_857]
MVLVTGAAAGAIATCPPIVALLGPGATVAGGALVPTVAAIEGITGAGAAVLAVGEGAVVGVGVIGGGSSAAGIALATLVGPIGWAVVGCNRNNDHNGHSGYTWDCWKPVVMDNSVGFSHGITLRDLYNHPNLKQMTIDGNDFVAENIQGEQFR